MLEQNFKHGIFKEELKNRFLCRVEVDGEDTLCYIPASCRLSNFIDLTGREVLVSPVLSSDARTKYSVYEAWAEKLLPANAPEECYVLQNN